MMYVVLIVCGPMIGIVGSYYITIAAVMGKLYSNSLLIIFNSRAKISGPTHGAESSDLVVNSNLFDSHGHRLVFRRSITVPDRAESFGMAFTAGVELGAGDSGDNSWANKRKESQTAALSVEHEPCPMDPRLVPSRSTNPPKIDPGVHGFVFIR